MTNRTALEAIVDLEQRYPVDSWTVDGLHVWPLLRVRLYFTLLFAAIGTGQAGAGQRSAIGRMLDAAKGLGRVAHNSVGNSGGVALPRASDDAVLLSDGVSLASIEGRWLDRLMDPIAAGLTSAGLRSFLMTPGTVAAIPRHTPSLGIQPLLDADKALSLLRARLSPPPSHELDGVGDALAELAARHPAIAFPSQQWLIEQAVRVEHMARLFHRLIERTSARAAFASNYYGAEGMAFVLAARRAGCVTVDVQHGLQVDHVGYAQWTKLPYPGYALVPDRFWCWSDMEVQSIGRSMAGYAHRGVAVGNLWSDFLAGESLAEICTATNRLRSLRQQSGRRYQFLLTPSWGHPDAELQKLLDAAAATGSEAKWWLRLHPSLAAEREPLRRRLAAMGVNDVEVDAANDYPLPLLLREMDVNLTQDSSTVIEAAVAGVPSVVTTQNGAEIFAPYIQKGQVRLAQTPAAIAQTALDLARQNQFLSAEAGIAAIMPLDAAIAEVFAATPFPA